MAAATFTADAQSSPTRAVSSGGSAAEEFFSLFDRTCEALHSGEVLLAALHGESSTFIRLTAGRVRHGGTVHDVEVTLDLIAGDRHAQRAVSLTGVRAHDEHQLRDALENLRVTRAQADPDPHLSFARERHDSFERPERSLPPHEQMLGEVLAHIDGRDLVGVLAAGPAWRAFASSTGQRNWYETDVFHLDVSLHAAGRRAAKLSLGGTEWSGADVHRRLEQTARDLDLLERPAREARPGRYRAYLAPRALEEILGLLAWGAFGLEAHRTRQTPLLKMIAEERGLHPSVTLREQRGASVAAPFTSRGFPKPAQVVLIEQGRYRDCLVDARSAKRYGVSVNAETESPEALDMAAGAIAADEAAAAVGDGLYISDIWYTNFSDPNDCRITGMTRYASFWVEGGNIAAPLAPMRFDDSLYHFLGYGLEGITRERERLLDQRTYGARSLRGMLVPGILVDGFRIAL